MEPLVLSDRSKTRKGLFDLALELTAKSAGFCRSLPPALLSPLADLVRAMNCYYSNLIEGHDTHPVDIEKAMKNDYSADQKRRDLQIEAKAHVDVQQWIDQGGLRDGRAFTTEGMCKVHRRFCTALPEHLLWVEEPHTKERVRLIPGELRHRDVKVGDHIAVSPLLANSDLPRRNDLDGRGALSEEALAEFTAFCLRISIDQVEFMEGLMRPDQLRARLLQWAGTETRTGALPAKAAVLLETLLYRGEIERGEVDSVLGVGVRQARRIASALVEREVLASESPRAPLRLAFPAALTSTWMPGLFPEQA